MTRGLCALLLLAACTDAELDPAAVQTIPPGDATGSALTGSYQARRVTRSCAGTCGGTTEKGVPISVCDVGEIDSMTAQVTQDQGRLSAEVDDLPALYYGGINRDGSYDLGAYATQGATLNITVRTTGTLAPNHLSGVAHSRSWGSYAGVTLDCQGAFEITPAAN